MYSSISCQCSRYVWRVFIFLRWVYVDVTFTDGVFVMLHTIPPVSYMSVCLGTRSYFLARDLETYTCIWNCAARVHFCISLYCLHVAQQNNCECFMWFPKKLLRYVHIMIQHIWNTCNQFQRAHDLLYDMTYWYLLRDILRILLCQDTDDIEINIDVCRSYQTRQSLSQHISKIQPLQTNL
jgi:hypothetical protein